MRPEVGNSPIGSSLRLYQRAFALSLIVLLGITTVFLLVPANNTESEVRSGTLTSASCSTTSASDYYFPAGIFRADEKRMDEFLRSWFSKQLWAMSEPSLSCEPTSEESYRFLWLRSFHHPIAIRIRRTPRAISFVSVELTGHGGHEPGTIKQRNEKALTAKEWSMVKNGLTEAQFWQLNHEPPIIGADGAEWILEGHRANRYQLMRQWSPESGPLRRLCLLLLKLSELAVPETDVY